MSATKRQRLGSGGKNDGSDGGEGATDGCPVRIFAAAPPVAVCGAKKVNSDDGDGDNGDGNDGDYGGEHAAWDENKDDNLDEEDECGGDGDDGEDGEEGYMLPPQLTVVKVMQKQRRLCCLKKRLRP